MIRHSSVAPLLPTSRAQHFCALTNFFRLDGVDYTSLEEFRSRTGHEAHGFTMALSEFIRVPSLAANTWYQPGDYDLTLRASAQAVNRGVRIPGLNDETPDGKPDIGAHERGSPLPHYGPRAPGNDDDP
jgi:hypothetical protein